MIFVDLETASRVDLSVHGGRRYAASPETRILCGVLVDVSASPPTVMVWSPTIPKPTWIPDRDVLRRLGIRDDVEFRDASPSVPRVAEDAVLVGWNSLAFDRLVWEAKGLPRRRWLDAMHRGRRRGLPGSLDKVGEALFGVGKDPDGEKLISTFCKPQTKGPAKGRLLPLDPGTAAAMIRYCVTDALILAAAWDAEDLGAVHVDDPVLEADLGILDRGIPVDLDLARGLLKADEAQAAAAVAEALADPEVGDVNFRSRDQIIDFAKSRGVSIADARRSTVEALAKTTPDVTLRRVLNARLAVARVTGSKLQALLDRACPDSRLRDWAAYWGAHTGRWAGRGFQPQNATKVVVKDIPDEAYDDPVNSPATVSAASGSTKADVIGSMIRGVVRAPRGRWLGISDYKAVEARGLLWMAGDDDGLDVYRNGLDAYVAMASKMFGVPYSDVSKTQRAAGKLAVLACGYAGGPMAVERIAASSKIDLKVTGLESRDVVEAWRDANPLVAGVPAGWWTPPNRELNGQGDRGTYSEKPSSGSVRVRRGGLWKDVQAAAASIAKREENEATAGRCLWTREGAHLVCVLPSGRPLVYRDVRWEEVADRWGGTTESVTFLSNRGYRNATFGGRLVENCFTRETRVVCLRGILPIAEVTKGDLVWDGVEWVKTDGAVSRGTRRVGEWLGVKATSDHSVLAGSTWKPLGELGVRESLACLRRGRSSAPCSCWIRVSAKDPEPSFCVGSATAKSECVREPSGYGTLDDAAGAGGEPRGGPKGKRSSRMMSSDTRGSTDTPGWFRDARDPRTPRGRTTEAEESRSTKSGWKTDSPSSDTSRPSPTGMSRVSISTASTTTGTTNRETCALYQDPRTRGTRGAPLVPRRSTISAPAGHEEPSTTTYPEVDHESGSWNATEQPEEVFDLLNCGPRERFMVVTDYGPVIAHNCVQAACRDLVADAVVRIEEGEAGEDVRVVLHVHDEVVVESGTEEGAGRVKHVMETPPPWAAGFPIECDATVAERYTKPA